MVIRALLTAGVFLAGSAAGAATIDFDEAVSGDIDAVSGAFVPGVGDHAIRGSVRGMIDAFDAFTITVGSRRQLTGATLKWLSPTFSPMSGPNPNWTVTGPSGVVGSASLGSAGDYAFGPSADPWTAGDYAVAVGGGGVFCVGVTTGDGATSSPMECSRSATLGYVLSFTVSEVDTPEPPVVTPLPPAAALLLGGLGLLAALRLIPPRLRNASPDPRLQA